MITGIRVYRYFDAAMLYDYLSDISLVFNLDERFFMSADYDNPGKPTPKKTPVQKKKKK